MACRSPFSSKTPTGGYHSGRRLCPMLGSSGGVAQGSDPSSRKPSDLSLLTTIATRTSRAQCQWKPSIQEYAGARVGDRLDQIRVGQSTGLKVPTFHTQPSTQPANRASVGGGLQETPKGPQRRPLIPTPEVVGRSPPNPSQSPSTASTARILWVEGSWGRR
jgi:hypothetical protein